MNYYQFHIADFTLHTAHLTLEEEGVYRRLLDFYYDTESPIPEETKSVIRRLRLQGYEETVAEILQEFFVLEAGGWHNRRCDSEIEAYKAKAERAKANGKKGGRPKKNNNLGNEKPKKTQPVSNGLSVGSDKKANQEPVTKNQDSNSSSEADSNAPSVTPGKKIKTPDPVDLELATEILAGVRRLKPDLKTPNLNSWADDCRKMRTLDNRDPEQIRRVFAWANRDSFWQVNILSPGKLREKFDQLEIKSNHGGTASESHRPAPKKSVIDRIGEQARQGMANAEAREAVERSLAADDPAVRPQVGVSGGGYYQ